MTSHQIINPQAESHCPIFSLIRVLTTYKETVAECLKINVDYESFFITIYIQARRQDHLM